MPPVQRNNAVRRRSEQSRQQRTAWTASSSVCWLVSLAFGLWLTWCFWWPLWQGGGLVGGDLYPYFLPQKTLLAESLQRGELPLWNPFVGFGYPVLGESQTAALSLPNLILYSLFSVNTAYNISQIGHYLLAFAGTLALARRLGIGWGGGLLAATAFVFGWFPARISLEWAVIGGAWLVWTLWAVIGFLQTGRRLDWGLAALFLGCSLLAGHYNLAFITLLAMIPLPWLVPVSGPSTRESPEHSSTRTRRRRMLGVGSVVVVGFLLAAVQLLPTWELKSISQRQDVNDIFHPTYGHLPPVAISQLWSPWSWYAGEKSFDDLLVQRMWSVPAGTNQTEAQLYVGAVPFLLACLGLLIPQLRRSLPLTHPGRWLIVIGVSLFFASGWPTVWLSSLPGIGFFRGPGRYSVVAALGLALLAGGAWETILRRRSWSQVGQGMLTLLLLTMTSADLWAASRQYRFGHGPSFGRQVFYSVLVDHPPIQFLPESGLRTFLQEQGPTVRLHAPGANIATLFNVSALPVYLGLGPEVYESKQMVFDFQATEKDQVNDAASRLQQFGVTHLLLEHPLDPALWPVEFHGAVIDPFFNRALGRMDPFYLYRLNDSPGRISLEDAPNGEIHAVRILPNRVEVDATAPVGGTLVLRDLHYPGWHCSAETAPSKRDNGLFRSVLLKADPASQTIIWTYRPASVWMGGIVSGVGLLLLAIGITGVSARRRKGQESSSDAPTKR